MRANREQWQNESQRIRCLHALTGRLVGEVTTHELAIQNERAECGRGLSAPTESGVIGRDNRGAEAPPTFSGNTFCRFMVSMRDRTVVEATRQLSDAIGGTANNTNAVATLDTPYDDPEKESLRQKLNELITAQRR